MAGNDAGVVRVLLTLDELTLERTLLAIRGERLAHTRPRHVPRGGRTLEIAAFNLYEVDELGLVIYIDRFADDDLAAAAALGAPRRARRAALAADPLVLRDSASRFCASERLEGPQILAVHEVERLAGDDHVTGTMHSRLVRGFPSFVWTPPTSAITTPTPSVTEDHVRILVGHVHRRQRSPRRRRPRRSGAPLLRCRRRGVSRPELGGSAARDDIEPPGWNARTRPSALSAT